MTIGGVMKILTFAVVVSALAVLAAGCGGAGGTTAVPGQGSGKVGEAASAQIGIQPYGGGTLPGITVVGSGSAKAVPDVSDWSFGVQSDADTASAALKEASQASNRIVAALRGAGIAKDDLRTEQVSLYPQMTNDGRAVTGYTASSSVQVTVRDIGKAGSVVDAAVGAGANQVSGPALRVSDSRAQYRTAFEAALDDARSRAEAIAAKAGVTLGAPVAIVETSGGGSPVPMYDRALASGAEMQIEPGTQDISAALTVTFAIS
jgi:uncharacterized protein YggE